MHKNRILLLMISNFAALSLAEEYKQFPEQHMVVVSLEYNAGKDCLTTLQSIFEQDYHNYHVILIDDCSTDDSADIIKNYLSEHAMREKVHFIQNSTRCNIGANHELAISLCHNNDIVVHLDGDGDVFAHNQVLAYINSIYNQYPQTWMTYGSFIEKSTGERCFTGPLPLDILSNNTVRFHAFATSHLRTFKAWLFKQIRHEDFLYKGTYQAYGADLTFVYPTLEMAGENHVYYIDDILYIHDDHAKAPPADWWLFHDVVRTIKLKPPYQRLEARTPNDMQDFAQVWHSYEKSQRTLTDVIVAYKSLRPGLQHIIHTKIKHGKYRALSLYLERGC